jgi:hypothetical protein
MNDGLPITIPVWVSAVASMALATPKSISRGPSDVLVDAAASTKTLLMVTHLVAAAIVSPAVARRLRA